MIQLTLEDIEENKFNLNMYTLELTDVLIKKRCVSIPCRETDQGLLSSINYTKTSQSRRQANI